MPTQAEPLKKLLKTNEKKEGRGKEDRWREHNEEVEDFMESILFQREEQYDIKELEERLDLGV